jgi:NTE family protein
MSGVTWVFGGGGVGAIAWETGMLAGLLDEGVAVDTADRLLGTSAGAVVAAQLAGDTPIDGLYERQRGGVPFEVPKGLSWRMVSAMTRHGLMARSAEDFGRRIGRAAIDLGQEEAGLRRRVIEARLPTHDWGPRDLRLAIVDADTGAHRLLSRADDLPLVDAVMASCAIPLVWPVVRIGDHHYMDGGMRSPVNLDLAPGDGPVVALAATTRWHRWARFDDQCAALGEGRSLTVLTLSPEVRRAQGRNPLRLEVVPAVAAAGREQGRRDAALVRTSTRR